MIRKIYTTFVSFAFVVLTLSSCSDWLDLYPSDEIKEEYLFSSGFFVKFGGTSSIVNKESWLSVVCFLPYCTSAFLPL